MLKAVAAVKDKGREKERESGRGQTKTKTGAADVLTVPELNFGSLFWPKVNYLKCFLCACTLCQCLYLSLSLSLCLCLGHSLPLQRNMRRCK